MIRPIAIVIAFGIAVSFWTEPVRAQDAPDEPSPQVEPLAELAEPATEEDLAPAEMSAEDILREFQKERPTAEPLLPQETVETEVAPPPSGSTGGSAIRMPDGFFLVDRTGRLVQDGPWWTIAFVGDNNPESAPDPPLKLLPNQMLERAVREVQGGAVGVQFVVSGEVTDFMGENYLLLRKLMRKRDMGNLSN